MGHSVVRFPVNCPICGGEVLTEQLLGAIVDAWLNDHAIPLRSSCHDAIWNSSEIERDQIFEYAAAIYSSPDKSQFGIRDHTRAYR